MPTSDGWVEVRCQSPSCDRADRHGRLLFKRKGALVVRADRGGSMIAMYPLGAICKCGAPWRNPDLELNASTTDLFIEQGVRR